MDITLGKSRVVAGRYPSPGTDRHADEIRKRRGARGITPLDANLLHIPPVAGGYNNMLGAIRTKGKLPGDIREAMILRVAALNHAAFEWIHHEHIGRKEGLSTGQLYVIRDTKTPLPPHKNILTPFQTAAVAFTDHSTRHVQVPLHVIQDFKKIIKNWLTNKNSTMLTEEIDEKVDDFYVEAAMVVASYNMVSRFLLSTDVAGISEKEVPWPVERKESFVPLSGLHCIHAITLVTSPNAPWLVFANSLLTDWTMWNFVVPYFLDLSSSPNITYNILLHSQRGHGFSTLREATNGKEHLTTIPLQALDIVELLDALSIPTPVHSIIGVSQGGATALSFAASNGAKAKSIVACDTSPRTPAGNKEAWAERIQLVYGPNSNSKPSENDYAQHIGMLKLAKATVPRWFPPGSISENVPHGEVRCRWVEDMIKNMSVDGFVHGALALSDYDVLDPGESSPKLFDSTIGRVLLVAGSVDGGGKVGQGLRTLRDTWNGEIQKSISGGISNSTKVEFAEIAGAGHLPMIDAPEIFCKILGSWLNGF